MCNLGEKKKESAFHPPPGSRVVWPSALEAPTTLSWRSCPEFRPLPVAVTLQGSQLLTVRPSGQTQVLAGIPSFLSPGHQLLETCSGSGMTFTAAET